MAAPNNSWLQFWFFQADPKQYDVLSELRVGTEVAWKVTRFLDRYRIGDIVYLWISGADAGVYGWATVESEVFEDKLGTNRLTAIYQGVLSKPLPKSYLQQQPKVFEGLSILRNSQGTNFRITVLEAIELNRLIAANGDKAPPDPDQVADPNLPSEMYTKAVYVLDYRFDTDVKSIIASCLGASQNINGTFFPVLLIQITLGFYESQLHQEAPSEFVRALNEVIPLDQIRSALNFIESVSIMPSVSLSPDLANQVMVKRNVLNILASARKFAIKTTGREQIRARHLLGAILHGATESMQNYLQEVLLEKFSLALPEVRESYLKLVEIQWPSDRHPAWRALISEEFAPLAGSEAFSPLLTRIDSDTADESKKDLLRIDDDAIAISKVLCAQDASPPVAIGLFGEWGSGKTFFMRRIHRHVRSLTARVAQSNEETKKAYHSQVAQIWFNAWNYQDGKLWASLVNHVFAGLKQEMKRLNENSADEEFNKLMEKLDEDRMAEKNLAESSERVKLLNEQKVKIDTEISVLKASIFEIEKRPKIVADDRVVLDDRVLLNQLENFGKILEQDFGIKGAERAVADISDNSAKVNEIIRGFSKFGLRDRRKIWDSYIRRSGMRIFAFVSSLTIIVASFYLALDYWNNALLALVGPILPAVITFISAKSSTLGKLLRLIGDVNQNIIDSSRRREMEIQEKLTQNKKKLLGLEIKQLENKAQVETAKKEYMEQSANYGRPSSETFANFVYARAGSTDYKSQLGLLHTVRRDFSRLNELLVDQKNQELPKLDRIILYIDDLDRCEPEIVVDVLQAIHLMLAFPLFMVVVGVDARWLGRSLKRRYSFLVHERDDKNNDEVDYHAASTHDYLEKIFQIPFWLKRIDSQRANDMMKALLTPETKAAGRVQSGRASGREKPEEGDRKSDSAKPGAAQAPDSGLFEETEDQAKDYKDLTDDDEILINNLVSTRSLEMSEAELLFFQKLGAIAGRSPRAVKRFINLYRVLKASHRKARVVGFSDENGGFKMPLFLLAVICGSPKDAEELFQCITAADENSTIGSVLREKESQWDFYRYFSNAKDDTEIGVILERLKQSGQIPDWIKNKNEDAILISVRESQAQRSDSEGWRGLSQALKATIDEIGEFEVKELKEWIPDVARFSYREWVG